MKISIETQFTFIFYIIIEAKRKVVNALRCALGTDVLTEAVLCVHGIAKPPKFSSRFFLFFC